MILQNDRARSLFSGGRVFAERLKNRKRAGCVLFGDQYVVVMGRSNDIGADVSTRKCSGDGGRQAHRI